LTLWGLFELATLLALALMAATWLRWLRGPDHAVAHVSAQAARMLQSWGLLVWMHGLAWAWQRRAASRRVAWRGATGILYLGCGFVFSLVLAAGLELLPCPEDLRSIVWLTVVPGVAWLSSLVGCGLLWAAWFGQDATAVAVRSPAPLGNGRGAGGFGWLVGLSLLLSATATVVLAVLAGRLLATWYYHASSDRSAEIVGLIVYGAVYLAAALAALVAALVCGWLARRRADRDLLWLAGVLALIGGLQQFVVLGWPAIAAGVMALRAAKRPAAAENDA